MTQQSDLFYEPQRIIIEGNPLLQRVANEVLDLVEHKPELLDGDNLSVIDRRLTISLWLNASSGLRDLIPDVEQRARVTAFLADPKQCVSFDVVSRARRLLSEKDHIRLSKTAIESGIENKNKVERSLRK